MAASCPHCPCDSMDGAQTHAVLGMLAADDIDAALSHGLLDAETCTACEPRCNGLIAAARESRLAALAARDRHRARDARLQLRKAEREAARVPKATTSAQAPALPAAAADVLARALAKVRSPR